MCKFINMNEIHPSWIPFFKKTEIIKMLEKIEVELTGVNFTPSPDLVLRFAKTDLKSIIAVVLGKDPYPQKGVATGRSFEVSGVTDWFDSSVNSSLKNIIKAINKAYLNKEVGSGIDEVRREIEMGEFSILPPNEAFNYWEEQGVLFLNSALTCEIDKIGSHLALWRPFFKELIKYVTEENLNIKFFLWGKAKDYAKNFKKLGVKNENIYTSNHPCTNGDDGGYENGTKFLKCPCFLDTMKKDKNDNMKIDWTGVLK